MGAYDDVPWNQGNPDDPYLSQEQRDAAAAHGAPWRSTSMGDLLALAKAGDIPKQLPTIGRIVDSDDERGLFYRGKVNGIAGDSGAGKSWICLYAAQGETMKGNDVLWVDYEDDDKTLAMRMAALEWDDDQGDRIIHVSAEGNSEGGRITLDAYLADPDRKFTLIVFDSTGEALAADGASPNSDDDVARWFQRLPRHYAKRGLGVVSIDHIPKQRSDKGVPLFPIGSQRKRAAISGIQYVVDTIEGFSRTKDGRVRIICAKDRGGWYAVGDPVAEAVFAHKAEGQLHLRVWEAKVDDDHDSLQRPKPTVLMQEVSKHIEANPGCSKNAIERSVKGKAGDIRWALELLEQEGYVAVEPGKNRALNCTSIQPYRLVHITNDDPDDGGWDITIITGDDDPDDD